MDEEVEEEEEVEEIDEEVVEVEVEGEDLEDDDSNGAHGVDVKQIHNADEAMVEDEYLRKKHTELLALPPHGSEVYIGSIPHDASEEELKGFCESIGEATEVNCFVIYEAFLCIRIIIIFSFHRRYVQILCCSATTGSNHERQRFE